MAEARKWTQAGVTAEAKPGMYRVSPGLYLQVKGAESKSWIYRFTLGGKARFMGLGGARNVTLAQARKRVDDIRVNKVARGIDPLAEDAAAAEQERLAKARAVPFRQRAEEYLQAHEAGWRNPKHRAQWRSTLETYAYPIIGDVPAREVTASHIVDILRPIWSEKYDTARKVRGRIEAVLDYAADPDDLQYRNPAAKTAQLLKKLPKRAKGQKQHHPALPYAEIAHFMAALRARQGMAARALEFAILTAARTGEVLGAKADEIDERAGMWTVPGARMKGGREHRVPLSDAALDVLRRARADRKGDVLFPSIPHDRPLSNMALLTVLKRMARTEITVHGFRSTFKDWAREQTNFPNEVSEAALAHLIGDETERAYARGDLFEKRKQLMAAWAAACAPTLGANVVKLRS